MGRLIDADKLKNIFLKSRSKVFDYRIVIQEIAYAPIVEAIPKSDYENRLKADMVAMLEELKREIDEIPINPKTSKEFKLGQATAYDKCEFRIQQKIDKLREGEL